MKRTWIALIAVAIVAPLTASAQTSYTHATMADCPEGYTCAPKIESVYYVSPAYMQAGIGDVRDHLSAGDTVAPQTYEVTAGLEATGSVPADLMKAAAMKGVSVMPLITNAGFSQALMSRLLASPDAESRVISFLVSEAADKGYDGWQFDFEHMAATDSAPYSAFVARAAEALHAKGLVLSVAVVARTDDATTTSGYRNWSGVYDYAALARSADFLSLMAYDDPNSIGPTASLPYDEAVVAYALKLIPADKISLGIPFFYYSWDITAPTGAVEPFPGISSAVFGDISNHGGTYARWEYLRTHYGLTKLYDSGLEEAYSVAYVDGKRYVIWYDDATSMGAKLKFIASKRLRGFSAWALGQEFPDVWKAIDGYL